MQFGGVAFGYQVYGADVGAVGYGFHDFLDAISVILQQYDLDVAFGIALLVNVVEQFLIVFDCGVDENQFLTDSGLRMSVGNYKAVYGGASRRRCLCC